MKFIPREDFHTDIDLVLNKMGFKDKIPFDHTEISIILRGVDGKLTTIVSFKQTDVTRNLT